MSEELMPGRLNEEESVKEKLSGEEDTNVEVNKEEAVQEELSEGELAEEKLREEETRKRNRELCERYQFLIPSNRWSGMRITEAEGGGFWPGDPEETPEYDYEFTELDDMPDGWRIAYGEQMCEELKNELLEAGGEKALNEYRITQIKEKYGGLRWYDSGCTHRWYTEILPKYEKLCQCTCIRCGKPATYISTGWISPWCDDCIVLHSDRYVPIDEWFSDEDDEAE